MLIQAKQPMLETVELERELAAPEVWADSERAGAMSRELAGLQKITSIHGLAPDRLWFFGTRMDHIAILPSRGSHGNGWPAAKSRELCSRLLPFDLKFQQN